jgi:hypothetical protein
MPSDQDTVIRYRLWLQEKLEKDVAIQSWDAGGKRNYVSTVAALPRPLIYPSPSMFAIKFQVGNPQKEHEEFQLEVQAGTFVRAK